MKNIIKSRVRGKNTTLLYKKVLLVKMSIIFKFSKIFNILNSKST